MLHALVNLPLRVGMILANHNTNNGSFVHDAAGQAKDAAHEAGYSNLAGLIVIGGGLYALNKMGS